jgi:hypothetical protein
MSISIATMGMFNPCCLKSIPTGGGPMMSQERVIPTIFIKNVEMESKNSISSALEQVKVKLVDFD